MLKHGRSSVKMKNIFEIRNKCFDIRYSLIFKTCFFVPLFSKEWSQDKSDVQYIEIILNREIDYLTLWTRLKQ